MHAIASYAALPIDDPASMQDVELDTPTLRPHDLLIEVHAVSVNPVDFKKRRGLKDNGTATVLGFDGAGTVAAVGEEAEGFSVGDSVWWAGDATRAGANADLQAVDSRIVAHAPESVTAAQAASLPLTALTAWEGLFDLLRLSREDNATMLMVGGAGGVGSILCQIAGRLTGLRVIATASRPESRDWALKMGADAVCGHGDLITEVKALAPHGIEYVFSSYTPGNIVAYSKLLKPFGNVVSIDGTDESLLPLFAKSISMHWEYMFARSRYGAWDIAEQGRILAEVAELVDQGTLEPTATTFIDDFSAAGLREAHRLVESGTMIGKVVVHR